MNDSADDTWTSPSPTPPIADAAAPRVLVGRYRLRERIASGGMATVWRATDDVLAREVAIKVLHEHLAANEDFRERFRREAIAAAKLTHPNIVGLFDTGRDGAATFLVMEFVEGVTLKERLGEGPLPVGQACRVGVQTARALAYAHARGLVHRDVKPANILVADDGTVKVTDFGIAKADQSEDLTRTGTVLGTAAYVAPEQIRGDAVTGHADQYSLAVVLHEALTGRQPFKADTPLATAAQRLEHDPPSVRRVRPDVPRALDSALLRAMAREPEDRFADLNAFADALVPHADADPDHDLGPPVETPSSVEQEDDGGDEPSLQPHRRRRRLAVALAAAIIVVAVAGWAAWRAVDIDEVIALLPFVEDVPEAELIQPEAVTIYDPGGTGEERDDELPNLLDGDEDTTWRTEHYEGPEFGNLKEGVGFTIDLGEPMFVEEVLLRSELDGIDVNLRIAETIEPQPGDWVQVASVTDAGDLVSLAPPQAVRTQFLLVWINGELPPSPYSSGRYIAEFSQLAVLARPES